MGLSHLISVHPLQMTRFLDPLRIAHCTPLEGASLDHPLGQTNYVIRRARGGMHKWNSPWQKLASRFQAWKREARQKLD